MAIDAFKPAGGYDDPRYAAQHGFEQPSVIYFAHTKHDTTEMAYVSRGIYVGTGGNVTVKRIDGTLVTFPSVPGGVILPIRATHIMSTDTTASGFVCLA